MNEAAADILARMREQKAKSAAAVKQPVDVSPESFHTRLIQVPHRSRQLAFYAVVLFALFYMIVFKNMRHELSWMVIVAPVLMIGAVAILIPPVEMWEYRPWQTRARQYERHQIDRWLPR
jgi:hypothetical protein